MKTAFLIFGLMTATAGSARADISDSGNLIIGGQGIIGGTMTVSGSAFSVGSSTFVVAAGSITLGGVLNAAAAGIKWADGSTSTTAAGGGAGNAVLTATQTWSGANTFTSSVTVGPTVYSTTASYSSSLINGWSIVASTRVTAASSINFYNLYSTYSYILHWSLVQGGAVGGINLRFNDDSGQNYMFTMVSNNVNNGGGTFASAADTQISVGQGFNTAVGVHIVGHMRITALPDPQSSTENVVAQGEYWTADTAPVYAGNRIQGRYFGGAGSALSVMNFVMGGGNVTGRLWLEAQVSNPP